MLTDGQAYKRCAELRRLLPLLQAGTIRVIEYGSTKNKGQYNCAAIRIRYLNTAGGPQFGIRTVTRGIEGSGDYTPDSSECLFKAQRRMEEFERPSGRFPLKIQYMLDARQRSDQWEWYGLEEDAYVPHQLIPETAMKTMFANAEVINFNVNEKEN